MAHWKHGEVRTRFGGRCGYCSVSEIESGGALTVDHYIPLSANGDDSDDNLVYCCFRCNTFKGDFAPSSDDLIHGYRVLHPLRDDAATYFKEDLESGLLIPIHETGRFHINLLQLNRTPLVEHRRLRRLATVQEETIRVLEIKNELLRQQIASLENYIRTLRGLSEIK